MSSDAERLLINCGLTQYTSKFVAANLNSFQSMQQRRELIPALVPNKLHAERILAALGVKGTSAVGDNTAAPCDPVDAALASWEEQIRKRLRTLAQRQASLMVTRVPSYSASRRSATLSGSRSDNHDLVAKLEHCKTLLAATNSARRSHRKIVELRKLLLRYRNRAGDPAQVDEVQEQLRDNESYVQRILVMLEEEGKLVTAAPQAEKGDAAFADPSNEVRPMKPKATSAKGSPSAPMQPDDDAFVIDQLWGAATAAFLWKAAASVATAELEERLVIERAAHDSLLDMTLARSLVIHY